MVLSSEESTATSEDATSEDATSEDTTSEDATSEDATASTHSSVEGSGVAEAVSVKEQTLQVLKAKVR
jgi:nicotinate-nucleotide pyrophosphorylase